MEEKPQYTKEQDDAVYWLNLWQNRAMEAGFALTFLERELGEVHAITCKYRLECVRCLEKEVIRAQHRVASTGAMDVMAARMAFDDQALNTTTGAENVPSTPQELAEAVKAKLGLKKAWQVAHEIGITRVTMNRVVNGKGCYWSTTRKVLEWLKQRS